MVRGRFVVVRNPEADSSLPYLVHLPLGADGIVIKAAKPWPRAAKVFCHRFEGTWPGDAEILDEAGVLSCERRGVAVDLVLDRHRDSRSQLVFTRIAGGREAIFWQTPKTMRASRPGVRIPGRRASSLTNFVVSVDTRERYPWTFSSKPATTERRALPVGDYGVHWHEQLVAVVERKSLEDLTHGVSDGSFGFQLAALAAMPLATVVVTDRLATVHRMPAGRGGWLVEQLTRLQVRHPTVPIVFCDSRAIGEDWAYRFLGAALAQYLDTPTDPTGANLGTVLR